MHSEKSTETVSFWKVLEMKKGSSISFVNNFFFSNFSMFRHYCFAKSIFDMVDFFQIFMPFWCIKIFTESFADLKLLLVDHISVHLTINDYDLMIG